MKNKGYALSAIVYPLLLVCLLLILSILFNLNNKQNVLNNLKDIIQGPSSYEAILTTSTYAATSGQSCSGCQITSVSNYGACCTASTGNCSTLDSTDSNYHVGTCDNGQVKRNSVCGFGVKEGEYYYYDCKTTYTCPNGGTLSGTTCTKEEYTCPNGGTLNGTICEL